MSEDERPTTPPGPPDEACREFETLLREHGEYDARLERLRILADADAREAYLRALR